MSLGPTLQGQFVLGVAMIARGMRRHSCGLKGECSDILTLMAALTSVVIHKFDKGRSRYPMELLHDSVLFRRRTR
jgi:hypothetical protein